MERWLKGHDHYLFFKYSINGKLQTTLACLNNLLIIASEVDQLGGGDILHRLVEWLLERAKKCQKGRSFSYNTLQCKAQACFYQLRKLVSVNALVGDILHMFF